MISIKVRIDAHIYAEEKLCDDFFYNPSVVRYISPPKLMLPLLEFRGKIISVNVEDNSSIAAFERILKTVIWGNNWRRISAGVETFYSVGQYRAEIVKRRVKFKSLLDEYLDPAQSGLINISFLVNEDAGEVLTVDNLRFYMHSNEQGHNIPHVHVLDKNTYNECSISIIDGKKLTDSEFRSKDLRNAQRIIKEKQEFMFYCWNTMTNGIKIDINHQLGFIKY